MCWRMVACLCGTSPTSVRRIAILRAITPSSWNSAACNTWTPSYMGETRSQLCYSKELPYPPQSLLLPGSTMGGVARFPETGLHAQDDASGCRVHVELPYQRLGRRSCHESNGDVWASGRVPRGSTLPLPPGLYRERCSCLRAVRWLRNDVDCCREGIAPSIRHGEKPGVLRLDREALGELDGSDGKPKPLLAMKTIGSP